MKLFEILVKCLFLDQTFVVRNLKYIIRWPDQLPHRGDQPRHVTGRETVDQVSSDVRICVKFKQFYYGTI